MLSIDTNVSLKEYGSQFPPKLWLFTSPNVPAIRKKTKTSKYHSDKK